MKVTNVNHKTSNENEGQSEANDESDNSDDEKRFARFPLRPKKTGVKDDSSVSDQKKTNLKQK
jgi:hypothetical protein